MVREMSRLILALAASVVVTGTAAAAGIAVAEHPEFGPHLVDDSGLSLYMFEEDRREGERGRAVESDCIGECLARWPAMGGAPLPTAADGADPTLVGAFQRPDGKTQATYGGWPLYTFAEDFLPGDTYGHDFEEFGGEWYLITPDGRALGHRDEGYEHENDD